MHAGLPALLGLPAFQVPTGLHKEELPHACLYGYMLSTAPRCMQARTQELQRRFAGGGAVVYGQGGGSGSFPGHASAAPGISAGVSSSSMTGLGQGQGQQAGVLHGGQQMEERAALAARCEDLQRQLATVHGEVDSLVGRTHTMQVRRGDVRVSCEAIKACWVALRASAVRALTVTR